MFIRLATVLHDWIQLLHYIQNQHILFVGQVQSCLTGDQLFCDTSSTVNVLWVVAVARWAEQSLPIVPRGLQIESTEDTSKKQKLD